MKYIYGPVKSRRLGLSLGLTLTPYKICNFDCIYCQLGRSKELICERKEYIAPDEVLNELRLWLESHNDEAKNLNYITISGSGEPTLNSKIGDFIAGIKKAAFVPVAVITNSSLLNDSRVRLDILGADLIVPSLDAVTPNVFNKINRPHPDIKIDEIIAGIGALRKEFRGKIWLEVMLARGVNDDLRHIKRLKEASDGINPDKIQLNSPVRLTAEPDVLAPDKNKLEKIRELLGEKCEII